MNDRSPVPARSRTARAPRGRLRWLTLLVVLGAGCDPPGRPRAADRPVRSDRVLDFASLYGRHCAGCHGSDGKLGPAPPLNDPVFLEIVPDEVLARVIDEGRPGTPMPAFSRRNGGPLTDEQVRAIAEGLRPRWGPSRPSRDPAPPYSARGGGGGASSERGAQVFDRACAGCHGPEGEGMDAGAIHDPAFLDLISDQALRRYAITGRPDLGMPSYDGTMGRDKDFRPLTSDEIDDLVAHLAGWRRQGPPSEESE